MDGSGGRQNIFPTGDGETGNPSSVNGRNPTAMVNNEEWDLDKLDYKLYEKQSETNNLSDNQTHIDDNDDNQEDDAGFENDCDCNVIIDDQTQLSKSNYARRKYLFSPRHFQEDNQFEFSISSCKNLNYSSIKTKNKNPTFKPLKLTKKNNDQIKNVTTVSRLNLKYKKSNLLTPINKANLTIKKRIKNGKFEANISSASTNTTVSPSALMPTNNYSPRLKLIYTSTNSKIWYDPINDLYIPFVPIVSDVNLLLK